MINIQNATPEQIAWFKLAAAKRYQERNVPANVANELFNIKMAAVATALNVQARGPVSLKKVASLIDQVKAARK